MSAELSKKSVDGIDFMVPSNRNTELDETLRIANVFARSGFFNDASDVAKACVKIMAGREIGFGPFASMNGVYVIITPATEKRKEQTKIMIGATLMAAAVLRAGYKYRIKVLTQHGCIIEFFSRTGESLGESEFTTQNAKDAALIKDWSNWTKHPRNMLFARAMSNGVKWYCPDVFGGVPVYVPEEFGIDEAEHPLDVTPTPSTANAEPAQQTNGALPAAKPQSDETQALQAKLDAKRAALKGTDAAIQGVAEIVGRVNGGDQGDELFPED